MSLNDEDLRRLFRSYIAARIPENRDRCPSLEMLLSFFESPSRTHKKMKVVDHVTRCSACAKEFELLLEFQRSQDQILRRDQDTNLIKPAVRYWPANLRELRLLWKYSTVIIGAVLLICSLTVISQKWGHVGETRTTVSSLTLIQPNQDNPAKLPLIFKWKPVEGADYYDLEIFDETLMPVWKCTEIRSPYFAMPAASSGWLKFNAPYFWMTVAFRNKEKLAESDLARFVVTLKDH